MPNGPPMPTYTAISYAWGPAVPTARIVINGKLFVIRQNLYEGLRALLQCGHYEELFWVDQLCIDQMNTAERNHQVQMMGKIYTSAIRVLAWLGYGNINSELAFGILKKAMDNIPITPAIPTPPTAFADYNLKLFSDNSWEEIAHVIDLLRQPYWTRLWIVQEIVLANELILMYGHHSWYLRPNVQDPTVDLPFEILASNLLVACGKQVDWVDSFRAIYQAFNVLKHYAKHVAGRIIDPQYNNYISMSDAIRMALDRHCSDLRNKVFAPQNCVSADGRIDIDYSLSASEVFLRFLNRYKFVHADLETYRLHGTILRSLGEMMTLGRLSDRDLERLLFGTEVVDEYYSPLNAQLELEGGMPTS